MSAGLKHMLGLFPLILARQITPTPEVQRLIAPDWLSPSAGSEASVVLYRYISGGLMGLFSLRIDVRPRCVLFFRKS